MAYPQDAFDKAYEMRKNGNDDDTIRMVLVSKKMSARDIDRLFQKLDIELPPELIKTSGSSPRFNRSSLYGLLAFIVLLLVGAAFFWFRVRGTALQPFCGVGLLFGGIALVFNIFFGAMNHERQARLDDANNRLHRQD